MAGFKHNNRGKPAVWRDAGGALAKVKNLVGTQGDPQRNTFGDQLEQMIPSNEWVTFSPGIWFNRDHLTRECRLAIHSLVRVDFIAVTGLGFCLE